MVESIIKLLSTEQGAVASMLFVLLVVSNAWHAWNGRQDRQERKEMQAAFQIALQKMAASLNDTTVAVKILTDRVQR